MEDMTPEMKDITARVGNAWSFSQSFIEGRATIQWDKYRQDEELFGQLYSYLHAIAPHLEEAVDHFDDNDRARWIGYMIVYSQRLVVEHLKNREKEKFNFVAQKVERLLKDMLKKVTIDQMLAELDNLADNEKANDITDKTPFSERAMFYSRALPHQKLVMLVAQIVHGLDKMDAQAGAAVVAKSLQTQTSAETAEDGEDACCAHDSAGHSEQANV